MSVRSAEALQALASALEALPVVATVDVTIPGPTDPELEVTTKPGLDRVPPSVLGVLSEHDAGLGPVAPKGRPIHYVAEVRL